MDDDEYDTHYHPRPSRRLRWQNVLAVVLSGSSGALHEISDTLEAVASLFMQDGNYADDRASFHQAAALELESLISEVDE